MWQVVLASAGLQVHKVRRKGGKQHPQQQLKKGHRAHASQPLGLSEGLGAQLRGGGCRKEHGGELEGRVQQGAHAQTGEEEAHEEGAHDDNGSTTRFDPELVKEGPRHPGVGDGQYNQAVHVEHLQDGAAVGNAMLIPEKQRIKREQEHQTWTICIKASRYKYCL